MRAENQLVVRVENGVATFIMINPGQMYFMGSSGKSSSRPGECVSSFSVVVEQGKNAVVIIRAVEGVGTRNYKDMIYTIPIIWLDVRGLHVDLYNPFVPSSDRLLQVNGWRGISVLAEEQFFTYQKDTKADERTNLVEQGHRLVDDPNLLCRFVVGQATLADLEAAATLDKRDQIERDLAQAQIQAQNASAKLALVNEELRSCQAFRLKSLEENEVLRADLKSANGASASCGLSLINLQSTIFDYELLIEQIRQAIQNIGYDKTFFGWIPWVKVSKVIHLLNVFSRRDT